MNIFYGFDHIKCFFAKSPFINPYIGFIKPSFFHQMFRKLLQEVPPNLCIPGTPRGKRLIG